MNTFCARRVGGVKYEAPRADARPYQPTNGGNCPEDAPRKIAIIARCDKRHALAINCLSKGAFAVPFALLNEVFEPLVLYFAVA